MLFELFWTFVKIGLLSFGGGYAMISLLQTEVTSRGWLSLQQFTDIVAISQITPGPIAVNLATFVGYRQAGVLGSLIATVGVCLPSLLLVVIIVRFIIKFNESRLVKGAFAGIKPVVVGLILVAAVQIFMLEFFGGGFELAQAEWKGLAVFAMSFVLLVWKKANPIYIIIGAGIVGGVIF